MNALVLGLLTAHILQEHRTYQHFMIVLWFSIKKSVFMLMNIIYDFDNMKTNWTLCDPHTPPPPHPLIFPTLLCMSLYVTHIYQLTLYMYPAVWWLLFNTQFEHWPIYVVYVKDFNPRLKSWWSLMRLQRPLAFVVYNHIIQKMMP